MAEPDSLEQLIRQTREFVEARPAPDFVSAVMGHIEQIDPHGVKAPHRRMTRLARSLWTPAADYI